MEKTQDNRAAVLMTYSSVLREGARDVVPSRLSLLAALASREYLGDSTSPLIIAGEQSYADSKSTGELFVKHCPDILPVDAPLEILPVGSTRLINTTYQIEAVAEHVADTEINQLDVIGWGFHRKRIAKLFGAYASDVAINYVSTEEILRAMDPGELEGEMQAMGFVVDFETVMKRGIKKYRRREAVTRLAMLADSKGRIINFLSNLRDCGRFDDLTPAGKAEMKTTGESQNLFNVLKKLSSIATSKVMVSGN